MNLVPVAAILSAPRASESGPVPDNASRIPESRLPATHKPKPAAQQSE
ncbi:hypothetical protein [Archangium lansingense]|uniref:Uncharacterized protein n=1 Tax=Archangium lansingense TaxID=2995310 RepID=A0ABT4A2V1_9BACT|nr:hypothetical protein [Archangium lansinium]MCY1075977.1 hypothetical protein [Archangium lansinium]